MNFPQGTYIKVIIGEYKCSVLKSRLLFGSDITLYVFTEDDNELYVKTKTKTETETETGTRELTTLNDENSKKLIFPHNMLSHKETNLIFPFHDLGNEIDIDSIKAAKIIQSKLRDNGWDMNTPLNWDINVLWHYDFKGVCNVKKTKIFIKDMTASNLEFEFDLKLNYPIIDNKNSCTNT